MRTTRSALVVVACWGVTAWAGEMSPPAGPVSPTMKSLDAIEPRMSISAATMPGDEDSLIRITAPGSYYLTEKLIGEADKHGIEIAASDVTVDLMGFTLDGNGVGLVGIRGDGEINRITIRNGNVTGWTGQGMNLAFGGGQGRILENLHVSLNAAHGILTGFGALVINCSTNQNASDGILAGNGSSLENCSARLNGGTGIVILGTSVARACSARENTFGGFYVEQGGSVESCAAQANPLGGFFVRNGTRVTNCLSRDNLGDGINAGDECIIIGNTVTRNDGDGIETDGDSLVKDNVCSFNRNPAGDAAGIRVRFHGSRIDGNHLRVNDFGLNIMHTHNLIVRNSAVSNTTNYRIVPSNRVGAIINAPGSIGMIEGNSGGGLGTNDPWANMAF